MTGSTGGQAGRTATVTILFCDLVGSTERQSRLGDDAADEFRRDFFSALAGAVSATHGETVKNTGDGLMVVFATSAVDAVTCASLMHDEVEAIARHDPVFVRVGISAGEAAHEGDDWFGTPVNEAARLCAAAESGQTLASDLVRGLVGSRGGHQFRSVGAPTLKGLSAPLPAVAVVRTPIAAPAPLRSGGGARSRSKRWALIAGAGAALVTVAAVALVVTGGSDGSAATVPPPKGYTPEYRTTRCDQAFTNQVPNGTCGELSVPEDRAKPKGRWLHLPVRTAPSRAAHPAADPVIDIDPSNTHGLQEDAAKSPARDHADLLFISTRIAEEPIAEMGCPAFADVGREILTSPSGDPTPVPKGQAVLRGCHDRLLAQHVALDRYTLIDAAEDVLDLLRTRRFDHVNLVAGGVNAISAYAIERSAPLAVRSVTLESPVAPGKSPSSDPTGQLTHAFDHYVTLCRRDRGCARAFPDLGQLQHQSWLQANASPRPVDVPVPNLPAIPVYLDGDRSTKAIANTVGSNPENGVLAAAIAAPQTVAAPAAAQAGLWDYPLASPLYPWGRSLSTWCSYDVHTYSNTASISSDARPSLAGVDDGLLAWECAAWKVPKLPAVVFASVANDIPTLIVEGELNPLGSHQWTLNLEGGLTHVTTLDFSTLGGAFIEKGIPPCLNDLRRRFLADPSRRFDAAARDCAGQSPPISFATSAS